MRRNQLGHGAGPVREKEWVDWAAGREWTAGLMMDWAGLVGLGWVSLFPFLFATSLQFKPNKLIEFKLEFEFNPNTQTNKIMHQHEYINKVKTKKNFNY